MPELTERTIYLDVNDIRDVFWQIVGDTIVSATWTAETISPLGAASLIVVSSSNDVLAGLVKARIKVVQASCVYKLHCSILCASGQDFNPRIVIVVND